jgi:arylsulfatase A-like enzyme
VVAAGKPNFIIINIDDLGYGDIGPFGSTTPTPHLEQMAAEGRKLTSHYAAPVCSPNGSFADALGQHIGQRLAGKPAISLSRW